jgi:hypothetical protein
MGVGGQRHARTALASGKTRNRRLSGPQSRSERVRKISPPSGFDPWIVQPVVSRYIRSLDRPARSKSLTDCAILDPTIDGPVHKVFDGVADVPVCE